MVLQLIRLRFPANVNPTRWSYWREPSPCAVKDMTITTLFDGLHASWPDFDLEVDGLTNTFELVLDPTAVLMERIPRPVLSAHLVSFRVEDLTSRSDADLQSLTENYKLHKVLFASSKLQEIRLESTNRKEEDFRDMGFPCCQLSNLLPSLKRLSMTNYNWCESWKKISGGHAIHWDLSKLTHLDLMKSETRDFFQTIPPSSFANLRCLKIEVPPKHRLEVYHPTKIDDSVDRHGQLCTFINHFNHIRALEELSINCNLYEFFSSTVTRHGATLRTLKLYHDGYRDPQAIITREYLEDIRKYCPHLTKLSLKLEHLQLKVRLSACILDVITAANTSQRSSLLEILATSRNLRNITLRVPPLVGRNHTIKTFRVDSDLMAARTEFFHLLCNKEGAMIETMVFVIEAYSVTFPRVRGLDCSLYTRDLRVIHLTNDENGFIFWEEELPVREHDIEMRLWELDAI